MSKRANAFYLEHARVMQIQDRVVFLTETGEALERYFNLPEKNTVFLLLGKGTSITDAAARRLAAANVVVGFCGTGGTPLIASTDVSFLVPQSEYRPTEYMQAWVRAWFNDEMRLSMARRLIEQRLEWTKNAWLANEDLRALDVKIPDGVIDRTLRETSSAKTTNELLSAEAMWAKELYRCLAKAIGLDFRRESGKGEHETMADRINGLLDHGNYIAYGFSAAVLNTLGISFSLPLLHGKTRRGALVFDIADLIKDAYVMPLAFLVGSKKPAGTNFRKQLIEDCQSHKVLDQMFDFVSALPEKVVL